ncbi:hypothetical protein G4B88_007832 [Cannabis sativa]|uniref:Uncharacterized protein n=1 Tax=Cannabis sativa TaxID=3483 RepID=A0A7J6DL34_CANSA|nr:hypothetical protein G4B88_007832 [Cannabis sativa]
MTLAPTASQTVFSPPSSSQEVEASTCQFSGFQSLLCAVSQVTMNEPPTIIHTYKERGFRPLFPLFLIFLLELFPLVEVQLLRGLLLDRMWLLKASSRMSTWSNHLFSKGGKEMVLNAVVQAIPSYAMSCFRIPISICKKIESLMDRIHFRNVECKRNSNVITPLRQF